MNRRIAFITGASRGIGAEAAVALAREGFDVAITARTLSEGEAYDHAGEIAPLPGSLEATAAAVRSQGQQALCLQADILDEASTVAAARQALEVFGRVDLLFNNAAFQGEGNMLPVTDITREHFETIYQANIFTPLALIKTLLPVMTDQGSGTIINMLSATAYIDPPAPPDSGGWGFAYASSKAALGRLAGSLRAEQGTAVLRFLNLEPGTVVTEMMKQAGIADAILKYATPCPAAAIGEVVAWLAVNEPREEWEPLGVLHGPAIAKELGLLDAPSLLDPSD